MNIAQIMDLVVVGVLLYGFISGLVEGFLRKVVNILIAVIILYATLKLSPILIETLTKEIKINIPLFKGTPAKNFLSGLISQHIVNAICYFVVFIVLSFVVRSFTRAFRKKAKERKKEASKRRISQGEDAVSSTSALNRFFGGIWGLFSNACMLGVLIIFALPITGLESQLDDTIVTGKFYNVATVAEKFILPSGDSEEGEEDEASMGSFAVCTITRGTISQEECGYVYSGALILTTSVFDEKNGDKIFLEGFIEGVDYESEQMQELLDVYFKTLYSVPALVFLTGEKIDPKMVEKADELINHYLTFATHIPYDIYLNPALLTHISEMYNRYNFTEELALITPYFKIASEASES